MATQGVDIGETSMTAQQLAGHLEGLAKRVKDGSFGQRHFKALAEGRDPFASSKLSNADTDDQVERWRAHFKGLYRMNPDFSNLCVPERSVGFDRLIIVPKGLNHKKWVDAARTIHQVYLYDENLDGSVTVNDRTAKERSYGIWIRDRQEADEELMGKSAQDLATEKVETATLLERLVAGTGHLFEKMCHMDVENVTLCSGSRYSDDRVPSVRWDTGYRRVSIYWCGPSSFNSNLRARAVVS